MFKRLKRAYSHWSLDWMQRHYEGAIRKNEQDLENLRAVKASNERSLAEILHVQRRLQEMENAK